MRSASTSSCGRWSAPHSTPTGCSTNSTPCSCAGPAAPATPRPGSKSFIQSKGPYAYGGYPDIDALFAEQAGERDAKKRAAILDKIQQLTIDRVMYAPVYDLRALMGVGPRITKDTIGEVWMSAFPSYEDMEIKG